MGVQSSNANKTNLPIPAPSPNFSLPVFALPSSLADQEFSERRKQHITQNNELRKSLLISSKVPITQRCISRCVHNTLRYSICTCAQKLTRWPAICPILAHSTETKNKEKLKTKPCSSEETVRAKVREGGPGGNVYVTGCTPTVLSIINRPT